MISLRTDYADRVQRARTRYAERDEAPRLPGISAPAGWARLLHRRAGFVQTREGPLSDPLRLRLARSALALTVALLSCAAAGAQTLEDTLLMQRSALCTGFLFSHDSWDRYWEGTLERGNENIGTITTRNVAWMGSYGVSDRLTVVAMLPYVWTSASQGVLSGMSGVQDATAGAKYRLLEKTIADHGTLRALVAASVSTPIGDYTPDFQPLSIGMASRRASGRLTLRFRAPRGWFLAGSAAYTLRGRVKLDRPAYFTDGTLFISDEVAMPDVFDYTATAGYTGARLHVPISFSQQITLGGGDIRRQDMPFVSNRMDSSRIDAQVQYSLPRWPDLAAKAAASYTVSGRNVGQATTLTAGLLYTFQF